MFSLANLVSKETMELLIVFACLGIIYSAFGNNSKNK